MTPCAHSARFAAPQPSLSRTARRNERARQHRIEQLAKQRAEHLADLKAEQHELAVKRQQVWGTEVAHRDPHDREVYVVVGGDRDVIRRLGEGLRGKEGEILGVVAELDKDQHDGPGRVSGVYAGQIVRRAS